MVIGQWSMAEETPSPPHAREHWIVVSDFTQQVRNGRGSSKAIKGEVEARLLRRSWVKIQDPALLKRCTHKIGTLDGNESLN
jgi:hypothetical protein